MYGGERSNPNSCYNPVAPAYPVLAYYVHGRQRRCQEDPVSLPFSRLETTRTRQDNQVVSTSRGSALSNRIWNNTTLRSPKQQIWLSTTLCGGWCRRMALRHLRVACQKRRRQQHAAVVWVNTTWSCRPCRPANRVPVIQFLKKMPSLWSVRVRTPPRGSDRVRSTG